MKRIFIHDVVAATACISKGWVPTERKIELIYRLSRPVCPRSMRRLRLTQAVPNLRDAKP